VSKTGDRLLNSRSNDSQGYSKSWARELSALQRSAFSFWMSAVSMRFTSMVLCSYYFPPVFAVRWQTRYFIIGRKKTAQSSAKVEVAYHRADDVIQKLIRVLAA
jgi:hypothetical protein